MSSDKPTYQDMSIKGSLKRHLNADDSAITTYPAARVITVSLAGVPQESRNEIPSSWAGFEVRVTA